MSADMWCSMPRLPSVKDAHSSCSGRQLLQQDCAVGLACGSDSGLHVPQLSCADLRSHPLRLDNTLQLCHPSGRDQRKPQAVNWLESAGITNYETRPMAIDALKWAAYTYVIAAVGSLATLLYYPLVLNDRR